MPHDISGAGFHPAIGLDQAFGHSPTGSLGGRSVQQVPSGAPRAQQADAGGFGAKLRSLGERFLNAVTPHGVRAQSKYRAGLEATSRQVGELLGALSKTGSHKVDGLGARAIIDGLRSTMEPLVSRGASYDAVFSARVKVDLREMDMGQLKSLQQGLALARDSALAGDPHVALVGREVQQELSRRMMDGAHKAVGPELQRAIVASGREPSAREGVQGAWKQMMGQAGQLLRDHGQADSEGARRALIKDSLAHMLDSGEVTAAQARGMLAALGTDELQALQRESSGRVVPVQPQLDVDRILDACLRERTGTAREGFTAGARALVDGHNGAVEDDPAGPMHDPVGFARGIIALAEHFDALDVPLDPPIAALHAQTVGKLAEMLAPGHFLVQELSDEQLHKVNTSLARLGVPHGREEIQAEMRKRKDEMQQRYTDALRSACTRARAGDVPGMLRAFDEAQAHAAEAQRRHQRLDGASLADSGKATEFRRALMHEALKELPTGELRALWDAGGSEGMQKLLGAMGEAAPRALREDPELGHRMVGASQGFELLDGVVKDLLTARGAPPPQRDAPRTGLREAGAEAARALQDVYGIDVSAHARIGASTALGSRAVQDMLRDNLRQSVDGGVGEKMLQDGSRSGVQDDMWRDLNRGEYATRGPDGSAELFDRSGWDALAPHERTGRLEGGVAKLRDMAGGNTPALMALSKVAHQGVFAGVIGAMMTPDSPVRLPDGTPGRPLNGAERSSYDIASDGRGGFVMRCDYSMEGATHFMTIPSGETVALDPSSRMHVSFEVRIGPDGSAQLSEPLQCMHDVRPMPKSVEDIMGSPTPRFRAQLRDACEKEYAVENFNFLEAHQRFMDHPTPEGARALLREFVGTAAPQQINISNKEAVRLARVFASPEADAMTPDQLREQFGNAFQEVRNMVRDGALKRVKLEA